MKDPYKVLGVGRNTGQDDIKAAYRKLARDLHPDSSPDDPKAEEKFKELSGAYTLLSDPEKRARYNRGEIDAEGNPKYMGSRAGKRAGRSPFDDFFRGRHKRGQGLKIKGADIAYTLSVDFLDAARGATKRVSMANGKTLDVIIPPATNDGQTLRLKGQGTQGLGGGPAGDALVEIQVAPHPLFKREGNNIHIDLPVTLSEAVLGGKVEAPTIDGPVSLTVPAGSNTGTKLRLRGKGLRRSAKKRGDQYVTLQVVLPKKKDKDLEEFVKKWSEQAPYQVRNKALGV